jgi:hypothetical protein
MLIEVKDVKKKSKGTQNFNVPNTEEGRAFVEALRKFRHKGTTIRVRGRGSRKEHGNSHGITPKHSEWLAVYIEQEATKEFRNSSWAERYQQKRTIERLVKNLSEKELTLEAVSINNHRLDVSLQGNLCELVDEGKLKTLKNLLNRHI